MLIQFKSKARPHSCVQTITPSKNALNAFFSRKTNQIFRLQMAQSSFKAPRLLAIAIAAVMLGSCQKEQLASPVQNTTNSDDAAALASGNTPPKVEAGPMRVVVYPASSATTLSGSGSDASGSVTFKWTQASGVTTANIAQPNKASTSVSNLKPGVYTFVLTVTDNQGARSKDTTSVTVLQKMTWNIEGFTREALVHPAKSGSGAAPIIFAFHGHGGEDNEYAEKEFELYWPEAIVVYPQGIRTKTAVDKDGRKSGWQTKVGEVNSFTRIKDQDLKFFDAMLSTLKNKYNVNSNYIFAHGWSNGGEFIYNVLWTARPNKIGGLSPAGATLGTIDNKFPTPVIHVAGTEDDKVSFSRQQNSIKNDRTVDKCLSTYSTWTKGPEGLLGKKYPSPIAAPVVSLQYDGGHKFPTTVPPKIVQFFKEIAGVK